MWPPEGLVTALIPAALLAAASGFTLPKAKMGHLSVP